MKQISLIGIIAFTIFMIACDKDDKPDQFVRIENLTDAKIDIFRFGHIESPLFDPFVNLQPGETSDYMLFEWIPIEAEFTAKFHGDWYEGKWSLPVHQKDPAGPIRNVLLPSGYYTFTIIGYDTITNNMVVGLSEYF